MTDSHPLLTSLETRLINMDLKLDRMTAVAERVGVVEATHGELSRRLKDAEDTLQDHVVSMAKIEGRNQVIIGLLVCIGAPLLVAVITAAAVALFNSFGGQ